MIFNRLGWVLLVGLLLVFGEEGGARSLWASELVVVGAKMGSNELIREAAGVLPERVESLENWADSAVQRVEKAYRVRDHPYVRVWYRVRKDVVTIAVDEGEMHQIVFVGAGILQGFMYQVDFNLPDNIYRKKNLEAALEEIREKRGLANIYASVRELPSKPIRTPLNHLVPQRILTIYVVHRESLGWGLGMELSPQYGLLPNFRGHISTPLFDQSDRLIWELGMSLPYRQLLFEESPKFRWVHGHLNTEYRFPILFGRVAPGIISATDYSLQGRSDLGLAQFFALRSKLLTGLSFFPYPALSVGFHGGVNFFDVSFSDSEDPELILATDEVMHFRGVLRLNAKINFTPERLRQDLHDHLNFTSTLIFSEEGRQIYDVRGEWQWVFGYGYDDLIFRTQAFGLFGAVQFWDEVGIAGKYLRVFFDNRYWTHAALQSQVEFRLSLLKDRIKMSVFNDFTLFEDQTQSPSAASFANALGPGLHFLLYDLVAIDFYYGFGFDRVGFSHQYAFSMGTVY